jgi:hypothetical protein
MAQIFTAQAEPEKTIAISTMGKTRVKSHNSDLWSMVMEQDYTLWSQWSNPTQSNTVKLKKATQNVRVD